MNTVSITKGTLVSLLEKLLALPLLAALASATPCRSTQYDMMNSFAMGRSWSQKYHLTGNANPL